MQMYVAIKILLRTQQGRQIEEGLYISLLCFILLISEPTECSTPKNVRSRAKLGKITQPFKSPSRKFYFIWANFTQFSTPVAFVSLSFRAQQYIGILKQTCQALLIVLCFYKIWDTLMLLVYLYQSVIHSTRGTRREKFARNANCDANKES